MRKVQLVISALLLILLVAACAPAGAPAPKAPAAPAKSAWEAEWEKVQAAAKQEGVVVLYTSEGGGMREVLMKIGESQGIKAEVLGSRGSEFLAKVNAERRAGLYLADLWIGGYTTMLTKAKPDGLVQPLDPMLILPHLTDPEVIKKVWYKGRLWWVDKDHTVMIQALAPDIPFAVSTALVKPDEIKSWRDVLNPKWKGKIIMNDPTMAGAGQGAFAAMVAIMGEDYARELAKMEPTIMRDERLMLEWLAHGKVAMVFAPETETIPQFVNIGAPIRTVVPVEGTWLSGGGSGISWVSKPAHPNASKVFINWLTTKEGQEAYSPPGGYHSLRLDVSTAHLPPEQTRQEGVKYLDAYYTEEFKLQQEVTAGKLAKEIIGPLIKK